MALICGTSPDFMDGLASVDTIALSPVYADLASRMIGAGERMPPEFLLGLRMLEGLDDESVQKFMTGTGANSAWAKWKVILGSGAKRISQAQSWSMLK